MTDLLDRLRDADPLLTEPAPPPEDVAAMRRRVLDAARESRRPILEWRRTLAIAAAVALMAAAGVDVARRVPPSDHIAAPVSRPAPVADATRTQVHFSTPGGTRIVWTIDPAFQLTETR
jgi:hypothetical protein